MSAAVAQFGQSARVSMAECRRAPQNKTLTVMQRVPGSSPGCCFFCIGNECIRASSQLDVSLDQADATFPGLTGWEWADTIALPSLQNFFFFPSPGISWAGFQNRRSGRAPVDNLEPLSQIHTTFRPNRPNRGDLTTP